VSDSQDKTLDALVPVLVETVLNRVFAGQTGASSVSTGNAGLVGSARGSGGPNGSDAPLEPTRVVWFLGTAARRLDSVVRAMALVARFGAQQTILSCPEVAGTVEGLLRGANVEASVQIVDPGSQPDSVQSAMESVGHADLLYVGTLGWEQAKKAAGADDSDPFAAMLLEGLAAARPVLVLGHEDLPGLQRIALGSVGPDGRLGDGRTDGGRTADGRPARAKTVGASGLERRAQSLWRDLALLGLEAVAVDDVVRPLATLAATTDSASRARGGLVTEKDIDEVFAAGVLRVTLAPQTVVTPLARDRARELGVELRPGR